ncbi:MAG TPA: hypothetical protein VGM44_08995 [Polyangiaceae bacterium]|jgi:hypothetical protein
MRGLRLQIIALLAVLAVLVSAGSALGAEYVCHMTGRVVSDCCCATESASPVAPASQQARPADCCERIPVTARPSAIDTRDLSRVTAGPSLLVVLPRYEYAALSAPLVGAAPRSARAPPIAGPPLFVAHCALLI